MEISLPAVRRTRPSSAADARVDARAHQLALIGIAVCVLVAFALRLVGVTTRPFWQDEGLTLYQIQLSVAEILSGGIEVQGVMTQNTHPPLYFLLLGLFGRLVGYGQFAVRWFSIAWSIVAIPVFYVFARRLAGPRAGLLAALLAASSPLYLWYAQEVRMYSMVVCLSALSGYFFWRALTERTIRTVAAYALVTAALLWTHYTVLFLVAVQGGFFAVAVGTKRPRLVLGLGVLLGLAVAPFVPFVWHRLQTGAERDYHFVGLDTIARDLLHSFASGVSMPIEGIWRFDLIVLLFVLLGVVWLWWRTGRLAALTLLALLVVPPLLLYTASYVKPMYQNVRHLILVSPFFYLLAGIGFVGVSRWRWRTLPLGATLATIVFVGWGVLLAAGSVNYFTDPRYQKDDTRGMFGYVAAHFHPGDLVVLNDAVLSHVLEYEQPQLPWTALPHYGTHANAPEARQQFEQTVERARRIWFVYSPNDSLHDPDKRIEQWFRDELHPLEYQQFHGMTTELAVGYYDTRGVASERPPSVSEELHAPFTDGFDLYGVVRHADEVAAGDSLFYDLVWYVYRQPKQDYKVSLQLRDAQGHTWATTDKLPFHLIRRTSHWLPTTYLQSPHQLDVPPGTPPSTYDVVATLYDVETGAALRLRDGGTTASLGSATVHPASAPADWEPPEPLNGRLGDRLRLHGLRLPAAVTVGQGMTVEVFVSTQQVVQSLPRVRLELVDPTGAVVAQREGRLLPTSYDHVLPPDSLLRSRHTLAVPPAAEPGRYAVRAVFLNEVGEQMTVQRWWGLWTARFVTLGSVTVEDRPRRFDVPAEIEAKTVRAGAGWAHGVQLARVAVPERATGGETLPLTFVWRAGGPTDRSYKVFVHLRNGANEVVAQADAYPAGGTAPTDGWAENEVIVDERTLPLPPDLAAGAYRLVVGFYDEGSGARLPRADRQGDEYEVATLEVHRP